MTKLFTFLTSLCLLTTISSHAEESFFAHPTSPTSAEVDDDGGFEQPFYIETEYAEEDGPQSIEVEASEVSEFLQYWDYIMASEFSENENPLLHYTASGLRRVCAVSTKACEPRPYKRNIEVIVELNDHRQGQYMLVVADGQALWQNPISSGTRGYRTPRGTFALKGWNNGRLYNTRNHCSSNGEYGTVKNGKLYLAPMPYSIHFNGGIALHAGRVTGKPESHGCVRQPIEYARELYCLLTSQRNWERTTIYVR